MTPYRCPTCDGGPFGDPPPIPWAPMAWSVAMLFGWAVLIGTAHCQETDVLIARTLVSEEGWDGASTTEPGGWASLGAVIRWRAGEHHAGDLRAATRALSPRLHGDPCRVSRSWLCDLGGMERPDGLRATWERPPCWRTSEPAGRVAGCPGGGTGHPRRRVPGRVPRDAARVGLEGGHRPAVGCRGALGGCRLSGSEPVRTADGAAVTFGDRLMLGRCSYRVAQAMAAEGRCAEDLAYYAEHGIALVPEPWCSPLIAAAEAQAEWLGAVEALLHLANRR